MCRVTTCQVLVHVVLFAMYIGLAAGGLAVDMLLPSNDHVDCLFTWLFSHCLLTPIDALKRVAAQHLTSEPEDGAGRSVHTLPYSRGSV